MNLEQLQSSNNILYECVAGSTCYNLNTPQSDVDIRGIYVNHRDDYFTLNEPIMQISDKKSDILYYEIKKFIKLASGCNPNIIELLYIDDEHVNIKTPMMDMILENRDMFISKKCFWTFSSYASAQIKKCKGQNKWINNPQPKDRPRAEDYMYFVEDHLMNASHCNFSSSFADNFAFRPVKLESTKGIKVARVEHGFDIYRAYVSDDFDFFAGGKITCSSISKDEERRNFIGVISYNQTQYDQDVKNWKNYWDWVENRNDARWVTQENGDIDYDAKNVMHSMRLIRSTKSLLENGYPKVKFHGDERDFLMKIRNGGFSYEEIMDIVESEMNDIELLNKKSTIPEKVNMNDIEKLYKKIMKEIIWTP